MNKFLLEDFAGGAVAERIGSAIQRVYENIANPNMDTEKARKLTIELTFKPDKNDRTDVDVTVIVKTSLQPERAISSRMIVESDGRGNVQGNEWRREAMKGQLVAVTGRLQVRSWEDNEGKKRWTTEVIVEEQYFAESKKNSNAAAPKEGGQAPADGFYPIDESVEDDDLPF